MLSQTFYFKFLPVCVTAESLPVMFTVFGTYNLFILGAETETSGSRKIFIARFQNIVYLCLR